MTERDWFESYRSRVHGRTAFGVRCPFCDAAIVIFAWSFAGHGKKACECGAVLYRGGVARKG